MLLTNLLRSSSFSLCFPFASGEGTGISWVKLPLFGFLIVLGLVEFD